MASPPNSLYMTKTLEVDKNLLSKLQMSKFSQTTGNNRTHEQPINEVSDQHACRERHVWRADQLKLALHRILPTSPTLHRNIVLVTRFRKSISYNIENILSEIYFASNFWRSYIPSNIHEGRLYPQSQLRHLTAQCQVCHELRRNSVWMSR